MDLFKAVLVPLAGLLPSWRYGAGIAAAVLFGIALFLAAAAATD